MFDNEFPPLGGGTGVVNYHLLQQFAAYPDVTVDLITSSRDQRAYQRESFAERITVYKVPVDNRNIHHATNRELIRYAWRGVRQAARLQRQHVYDLSFAFAGVPAGAMSYLLFLRTGLPYLVSLQGPDVPGFEARYNYLYPFLKPLLRRIWRRADVVTAISQEQCDLARCTLPTLPLVVIPNGVDTTTFVPRQAPRSGQPVSILCVARLIERKGQDHLLRAFALLRKSSATDVRLILVGTGDAHHSLEALTEALGVADSVCFRGFVPREAMPEVYQEADIFVLPSQHEGMSMALLEAMGSGLPVVVTDTGGTAELVSSQLNGDVVPWADVTSLMEALRRLVEDPARRREFGLASRDRALAFGWPRLAEWYLALCHTISSRVASVPSGPSSRLSRAMSTVENKFKGEG